MRHDLPSMWCELGIAECLCWWRRVQMRWPSSQADVHRRTVAQRALLQGWLTDVHPTVFSTLSSATAVRVRAASKLLPCSHSPKQYHLTFTCIC